MAQNTFRTKAAKIQQERKQRFTVWINDVIGLDKLFGKSNPWPIRYIDRIFWIALLMLIYIYLRHNAEKLIRQTERTKTEIDELRAQHTTLQADFMKSGKQSVLGQRVAPLGLIGNQSPPRKIIIEQPDGDQR